MSDAERARFVDSVVIGSTGIPFCRGVEKVDKACLMSWRSGILAVLSGPAVELSPVAVRITEGIDS